LHFQDGPIALPDMLTILKDLGSHALQASPQAKALGLTLVSVERGEATVRCPYRPELVGDVDTGVVAGGVVTTLLDHTCGQAVLASLETYRPIATLDLRIDYLRAAQPGLDVMAYAHCYKLTRSVAFVRATAYDQDRDDPVATVQATFMLDSSRTPPPGQARTRLEHAAATSDAVEGDG
jgi:uncharacterized protein (TIGR00369 family)